MITYIKRENLNIDKYDACIENAAQSRIYAFSWYLDIVADNWDVLVLDDYKAVMPLPWKQKYFLKYISQPFFCQQLGVFSNDAVSESLLQTFISSIPITFIKVNYHLNSDNKLTKKGTFSKNYILHLFNDYTIIKANYRKDRKDRIKQAKRNEYQLRATTADKLIKLGKAHYNFLNLTTKDYLKLKALINTLIQDKKGFVIGAFHKNGELLGGSFFLISPKRIYYLYSAVNEEGRKNQVASLILDSVIENYSKQNYTLDFEGSVLPGIESFFKSFGAKLEEYKVLRYNTLPFFMKLFKQ